MSLRECATWKLPSGNTCEATIESGPLGSVQLSFRWRRLPSSDDLRFFDAEIVPAALERLSTNVPDVMCRNDEPLSTPMCIPAAVPISPDLIRLGVWSLGADHALFGGVDE